jgi:predicted DCC family thiol-disulfide oxidoreductase YuxK
MSSSTAVVLYDGVCGFCHSSVQFIIRRDPNRRFVFEPLQSEVGRSLAESHGIDALRLDGLVLIEDGVAYQKSTAALRIARRLRFPWPMLTAFLLVPRPIRDWLYDQFAKRRYRWFGKTDVCQLPAEHTRK